MVLNVQLRRFGCVMGGVVRVAICRMRMVSGCLMVARLVMPGGFTMMSCRVFMVLRGFEVMLCCLLRHGCLQIVAELSYGGGL